MYLVGIDGFVECRFAVLGSVVRAQLFPALVRGLIHVFLPLGTRLSVAETVRTSRRAF